MSDPQVPVDEPTVEERIDTLPRVTREEIEAAGFDPRWGERRPQAGGDYVDVEDAALYARMVVHRFGSILQAGYAFSERHGYAPRSGERILQRILHHQVHRVRSDTLDRLWVLT